MRKINASSVYFVLIISLVVFILLGSFLAFVYYNRQYLISYEHEKRVYDNIRYAEQLYLKDEKFRAFISSQNIIDLFSNTTDSVFFKVEKWGLYNHVKIEAKSLNIHKTEHFLSGNTMAKNDTMQAVLYLKDLQNLIALAGDTRIDGNSYLPEAGAKPTIMLGKPFQYKQLTFGKINKSTNKLPNIDSSFFNYTLQLFDTLFLKKNYKKIESKLVENGSIHKEFSDTAILFLSKEKLYLKNITIKGHVVVCSTEEIVVTNTAILQDILLIAPIIRFEKGFVGSLQSFAKDSLIVSNKVELNYPSVLYAVSTKENDSEIRIHKGAKLSGVIIGSDDNELDRNARVTISENSYIKGLVWAEGFLQLKTNVSGYVFTHKFIWNTMATIYENHLLDIHLSPIDLSENFSYPLLFPSKEVNILKRL